MNEAQGGALELFHFGRAGAELLGCHFTPAAPARSLGVVLCYPLGHEYLQYHRVFRQLSRMLLDAGFPVLRFDFLGCGDSAGDSADWRLERWREDVGLAVLELGKRARVSEFALVGMRLGGTLAAQAASTRDDVRALVLWDAVSSGRSYLEELRALHAGMLRYAHVLPRPARDDDGTEVLGFSLSGALVADLEGLHLSSLARKPAARALVIESHEELRPEPVEEILARLGTAAEKRTFSNPNMWVWTEDFGRMHVPHPVLREIVAWLRAEDA